MGEPAQQLRRDGRGAGDGQAAAQEPQALPQRPVDEQVRQPAPQPALLAARPGEERALQPAGVLHLQLDAGVQLLPDARHPQEHRGLDLAQVRAHGLDALAEVHGAADLQRQVQAEDLLRHVAQRQVAEHLVVGTEPEHRRHDLGARHRVPRREEGALGRARGARGVDHHRRLVGVQGRQPLRPPAGRRVLAQQLLPAHEPRVVVVPQAPGVVDHDALQAGHLRVVLHDLVDLLLVLGEEQGGAAVREQPRDLVGRVGLVDAHAAGATGLDGQVRDQPLRPVVAEDAGVVPGPQAPLPQRPGGPGDPVPVGRPVHLEPQPAVLVPQGGPVRLLGGELLQALGEGPRHAVAPT